MPDTHEFTAPGPRPWQTDAPEEDRLVWRTLADIDDAPPRELLFGMLEPDGPTLLYGPGGTGKGTSCAWLIHECVQCGMRPMIYDAENHPLEWRRRVAGLGVPPEHVVYVEPRELPGRLLGKPLDEVVPHLGEVATAAECGILFVDSVLAGSNLSEEGMKSNPRMPYQYVAALARLEIPTVSIGHTSKHAPDGDPYGSVSWTNAMRLVWHGAAAEGGGHRVRWQLRKKNERGHIPGILLAFQYDDSGRLCGVQRDDDEATTKSWLHGALLHGPRALADLAEELAETDDAPHEIAEPRANARLRQTLRRMCRAGQAHKVGNGRKALWALGGSTPNGRGAGHGE